MTTPPRPTTLLGRSTAARVLGWLFALVLVVGAAGAGSASTGGRGGPATTPTGIAAHLGATLEAAVVPVAATVAHPESPRLLHAADAGAAVTAALALAFVMAFAGVTARRTPARTTLPLRRGPPSRLSSR